MRLVELRSEFKAAGELAGRLRGRRDEARQKRAALHQPAAEVEEARAFLAETKERQTLSLRLEKLRPIQAALLNEKSSRSALVAPDDKTIREVRKHLAAKEAAEATLQASLIRLTLRPRQEASVTGQTGGEITIIPAGRQETFAGSPQVSVEVEGFGVITAAGPGRDVDGLREERADAGRKAGKLAQPYGVEDPDRLQLLRDQAVELDQKIKIMEKQIEGILAEETVEDLRGRMAKLNSGLRERTKRFPNWLEHPPVLSDLQTALERRRHEIEAEVRQAEDACDQAQAAAEAVGKRLAQTEAGAKNAGLNLEAAAARLAELTKDGLTDEVRQTARQEMAMSWEAARSRARDCGARLAVIGDDPKKTVEKLEARHRALEDLESTARDGENKAEGRLQALAAEGTYSKLAACEERLADLNDRLRRERLRMDALRLLYDTVARCKAAAVAAVAAPVERNVTRMLARVAGPRLGTVRLTDQFVPTGIKPLDATEAVELDNLSGGEQEQLFLLSRLALGQVLAQEERQLVVLDDVLNATDTGRLARLLSVLEEAASQLQIVILTCHPERYRALEKASFFDLLSTSAAP